METNKQSTINQSINDHATSNNKHSPHIAPFCVGMVDREVSLTDTKETTVSDNMDSQLINDKCTRNCLWDIHLFIEQVLATDKLGFAIITGRRGEKRIKQLALGRYFPIISSFISRIPEGAKPGRFVGLFLDCVHELQLHHDGFTCRSSDLI